MYFGAIRTALITTIIAITSACSADTSAIAVTTISAEQGKKIVDASSMFLLDVRSPGEYGEVHIAGAFLLPVQDMPDSLTKIDSLKQKPILVYCRSGHRSRQAADIMMKNGFSLVSSMEGGINAWEEKGFPVQTYSSPAK